MRLARKITLAVAAAIVVVMAAHAYFLMQRQVVLFDADLARSVRLKQALRASIDKVWEAYGDEAAQDARRADDLGRGRRGPRPLDLARRATGRSAPRRSPREQLAQLATGDDARSSSSARTTATTTERYTYVPQSIDGCAQAVLEFVESIHEQHAFVEASRWQIRGRDRSRSSLACAAAVYGLGFWFVGRPMRAAARPRPRGRGAATSTRPIDLAQHDEIGELAREINDMCRRLAEARARARGRDRGAHARARAAAPHRSADDGRPARRRASRTSSARRSTSSPAAPR